MSGDNIAVVTRGELREETLKVLRYARDTKSAPGALALVGPPGCAKTHIWYWVANEVSKAMQCPVDVAVFHPGAMDPTDVPGIQMPDSATGTMRIFASTVTQRLQDVADDGYLIPVWDDIAQAKSLIQGNLAHIIYEGECQGVTVPRERLLHVLTGNRRTDKAGAQGYLTMLLNRTRLLAFAPTVDEWVSYMYSKQYKCLSWLAPFARWKPSAIMDQDADMSKVAGGYGNFATFRTWEMLARDIDAGIDSLSWWTSCVGESAATEAMAFKNLATQLPSFEAIVLDPEDVAVPSRADVQYAIMGMLAHHASGQTIQACLKYAERLPNAEMVAVFVKDLLRRDRKMMSNTHITKWAVNHQDLFRDI